VPESSVILLWPAQFGTVPGVKWKALGAQLVRARRGARTQKQLSQELGYQSNVVFAWENERDEPSARVFFRLAEHTGMVGDLSAFLRGDDCLDLSSRENLCRFLRGLMGNRKVGDLATQMQRDRHAVGRWIRGQTEISLGDLLNFVEVTTLGVYDFLAAYVNPSDLPEAKEGYELLSAARESARQKPWSHAIVHMVELPSYQALPKHEPGWFASRLGITTQDEMDCLQLLVKMGQLYENAGLYRSTRTIAVDTRRDPEATRQLASFWMKEGAERVLKPGNGRFAFNTFAINARDLVRVKELQSEYFRQLRALVADSQPAEAVAVATFQLFPLFEEVVSTEKSRKKS
jgi:transcriptional regulator with XRE-family HTH domain